MPTTFNLGANFSPFPKLSIVFWIYSDLFSTESSLPVIKIAFRAIISSTEGTLPFGMSKMVHF